MSIVGLVLAACVAAQPSGVVRGVVINAATQQPVARASVLLTRPEALRSTAVVATDDQGRFEFAKVAPATYRVLAQHDDFLRSEPSAAITVEPGGEMADVTIALTPTAVISGRVTDEFGEPAARIYVRAQTARVVAETRTNDLGEYRLFGLPPGAYVISAERYPGPSIQGAFIQIPTPPCPDCLGEGVGRMQLSAVLPTGGFIDPRALTGETSPAVFFPGTTDRKSATPVKAGPGARVEGIDVVLNRTIRDSGFAIPDSGFRIWD